MLATNRQLLVNSASDAVVRYLQENYSKELHFEFARDVARKLMTHSYTMLPHDVHMYINKSYRHYSMFEKSLVYKVRSIIEGGEYLPIQ